MIRGTYCDPSMAVDTVHGQIKAIADFEAAWFPPFGVPQKV